MTPEQRVAMVRQLTMQAWAFKEGRLDGPRIRRDVVRTLRGGRFLTSITGVQFEEAWAGRKEMELGGVRFAVLSREDLIRNKLATGRPKDLLDVESLG